MLEKQQLKLTCARTIMLKLGGFPRSRFAGQMLKYGTWRSVGYKMRPC